LTFARDRSTSARKPGAVARKPKTPNGKVQSIEPRRCRASRARVRPLRASLKPSPATPALLRPRLPPSPRQGFEAGTQEIEVCEQSSKACVQWFRGCVQGWGGLRTEVWGLRAVLQEDANGGRQLGSQRSRLGGWSKKPGERSPGAARESFRAREMSPKTSLSAST
jgi:hypothetical protein